ncbi:MAG: type II secretion system F family protein [Proteobacteria bacterium]|nr:type II secretion system F family protein [Pseudomonadota bacterium]
MLTTQNIILVLSTIGAFLAIIAVAMPFLQTDGRDNRLKYLARRREELQAQQRNKFEANRQASLRRRETRSQNLMTTVLNRLNLMEKARSPELRLKMNQAGFRGQSPAIAYVFARLVLPLVMASVIALVLFSAKKADFDPLLKLLICAGAAGLGYLVPDIVVANTAKKRQQMMIKGFPDALDLIVICVEAGISLEQALVRVAHELAEMSPILAEEFGITTAELAYLGDRRMALDNLATRTGAEPIKALTTSLIQSEKYGTPLGVALRVLSRENRDDRMARAEQKAGSLPAALTVPMILFFLPVLFIVLIGPAIIQVIATFQE